MSDTDYLPRPRPFVYLHSDNDPRAIADGCDCGDREWEIETVFDFDHLIPGASAATLTEAPASASSRS